MHYSHETKAIRQRMEEVRCDLDQDVQGIVEGARDMRDWRSYVRTYPWVCVGAALAVGYLLVPRRHVAMQPNAETIAELVEQSRLAATPLVTPLGKARGLLLEVCGQSGDTGSVSVCRATSRQTFWATGRQFTTGRSTMKNRIPDYLSDSSRERTSRRNQHFKSCVTWLANSSPIGCVRPKRMSESIRCQDSARHFA